MRLPRYYRYVFFDTDEMKRILESLMDGHVSYKLGGKIWRLSSVEPEDIDELDCSGFTEYLLYKTTSPNENCPSGSYKQEKWFGNQGFQEVDYASEAHKVDGVVRIGFRDKTPTRIRHTWFVINGWTVECTNRGSSDGPTSLLWSDRLEEADNCFVLGQLCPRRLDTSWIPAVAARQNEFAFEW